MKRFTLALPLAAASVLFCLPAFGADTAPTGELQRDLAGRHLVVMLVAVLLPVLVKFFGNETLKLPYWAAKLRVAAVILLGGAATVFDQIQNGGEVWSAVTAAIMTTAPALLIELLQKFGGGGEVVGQTAKSVRPPAMFPPAAMLLLAIGFAGCAAKPFICPIVETAGELCQFFVVRLPDGSTERVPKSAIVGMAMSARAARFEAAKAGAADAGADR